MVLLDWIYEVVGLAGSHSFVKGGRSRSFLGIATVLSSFMIYCGRVTRSALSKNSASRIERLVRGIPIPEQQQCLPSDELSSPPVRASPKCFSLRFSMVVKEN